MNFGKKQTKISREKVSLSQTMDSFIVRDNVKGKMIIFAGLLALFCLSTTAFGVGTISGHVENTGGSSLANVWVMLYQGNDPQVADENAWNQVGSVQTDSSGNYQFTNLAARYYRVYIYSQNVGGTWYIMANVYNIQVVDNQNTVRDITLQKAGSISGYVRRNSDNSPMQGVQVQALQSPDENIADWRAWQWAGDATTDSSGFYKINGLVTRRYRVNVWNQEIGGTHYVEADLCNVQVFLGIDTPNMDFKMRQAARIWGQITTGGTPIPNARVNASTTWTHKGWGWRDTGTDQNGMYEFWVLPSPGEFYPVWVRNAWLSGTPYESKWEPGNLVKATIGADTRVDYDLEPGGTATGRVVNESGVGMSNVRVELGWNKYGDFGGDTWTDSQGNFRLGGLTIGNDNYVVLDDWNPIIQGGVKYMGGEAYKGPINITTGGQVVPIGDFTVYEAGMVTGVITDENGVPVVDVEVDLEGRSIDGDWAEAEDGLTDAFGQYTLDYVTPGTYYLECEKPGFLTTIIRDIKVNRGQHVDLDVVINSQAKGAKISGSITNYSQVAPKDSANVYYPSYEDSDYEDFGLIEFGLLAMDMTRTYTDEDYLEIDQFFVGELDDEDIEDGYGDYFVPDASETPGNYVMPLPPGDIGVGMYIDNPESLAGWGGSAVLHDWKRFTLTQGDDKPNIDFTANTGSTGELKGNLIVPSGYNYFPGDWCIVYAFALDSSGNRINPAFIGDAIAFCGFTTQYEIVNMPVGNYELKAYAMNLPSVTIPTVTVSSGATTTQDIDFTGVPSGTLSGKITNTNGGAAVSGATVKIVENGKLAVTDSNGDYTMTPMNTGNYTVNITAHGFANAQTTVTINTGANTLNYALDSQVGTISGTVKDSVCNNVNAATVVAYNETDYTHKTAQTVGGAFIITGLTPGQYVMAVDAGIYGVVTHPTKITLAAGGNGVANIIVGTPQPPVFTVSSSASNTTPVVLSMEFYSDQDLLAAPQALIVQGNGTLGSLTSNSALNRFNIDYTADAGDTVVRISIGETFPIVPGNPGSNTFSFEVTQNLVATSSTNVTNATGGTASMMGAQDNTEVYVPPFAIAGAGSDTQALTLTIERYGDPGQTFAGTTGSTASAVYDFEFDQQGVSIDTNHTFTVTMSFQLPAGMTQAEFENSLELRYFDAGDQQWKTDGISNVRINWLNYTIIFDVSHLTKFAAFVPTTSVDLTVDIYPNRTPNRVFLSRNYTLYVAVLGSATFDVTTLNSSTVKFGKTGTEASSVRPPMIRDLNGDGYLDAMYGFRTFNCNFALGDTQGWLKGSTASGTDVEGSDSVVVSP